MLTTEIALLFLLLIACLAAIAQLLAEGVISPAIGEQIRHRLEAADPL